jgi:hypothetical protein
MTEQNQPVLNRLSVGSPKNFVKIVIFGGIA